LSPNTIATLTSKGPRIQREHQLSLLWLTKLWRIYGKQEQKANASSNMSAHLSILADFLMDGADIQKDK